MKFSIRDLLLVTVIVALAVGWWLDRRAMSKLRARNDELQVQNRNLLNALGGMDAFLQETADHLYPPKRPSTSAPAPSQPRE